MPSEPEFSYLTWALAAREAERQRCGACGSTRAEREDESPEPTELRRCRFCGGEKCSLCDMGEDVGCSGGCEA